MQGKAQSSNEPVPSGGEQRKPDDGDIKRVAIDATPARKKTVKSKARSKDELVPDRSFFATLAALGSKRSSCEVTLHLGGNQVGSTHVQQDTIVKMRIPWKVETTFWPTLACAARKSQVVKLMTSKEKKKHKRDLNRKCEMSVTGESESLSIAALFV